LQNQADHCLVLGKGFRVPTAHPHPKVYKVPPSPGIPVDLY